jgi:DHA1 family inner membrane transport protein
MKTTSQTRGTRRAHLVLTTLFVGTFAMGSAELLVVGLLDLIADDLGVSLSATGGALTANALGLALGGPVLTLLTTRFDRRIVLISAMSAFVVANLAVVLSGGIGLLVAARLVAGAVQGVFIAAGFVTAMSVAAPGRQGRAISVVISGFAVSTAVGVPLGTLLGQALGWRGSFVAVLVLATLALVAVVVLAPSVPGTSGPQGQARYAFAPRVLAVLVVHFLLFAALFAAMTYVVPFLGAVTGVTGSLVGVFLLVYGVATAVGAIGGGRFADSNAAATLIAGSVGVAAALLVLHLVGGVAVLAAAALFALGLFAMATGPSVQFRVVSLAGPGGALASSLPVSAINVGIAFGSFAGGVAIRGGDASAAIITGLVIAAIAVPVAWATSRLDPPADHPPIVPSRSAAPTPTT